MPGANWKTRHTNLYMCRCMYVHKCVSPLKRLVCSFTPVYFYKKKTTLRKYSKYKIIIFFAEPKQTDIFPGFRLRFSSGSKLWTKINIFFITHHSLHAKFQINTSKKIKNLQQTLRTLADLASVVIGVQRWLSHTQLLRQTLHYKKWNQAWYVSFFEVNPAVYWISFQ